MENKIVEFTNEAIRVNSRLFNDSVEFGVDSAQQFVETVSTRSNEWLQIKTVDDYVKQQEAWNQQSVEQTQEFGRKVIQLGNEAYSAYLSLWESYAQPAGEAVASKKS